MQYLPNIVFSLLLIVSISIFVINIRKMISNIKLGKSIERNDRLKERFIKMFYIAFGQSKMIKRPLVGILHLIVYLGFIVINIELIEIIIDGILGTHRVFSSYLGVFYNILIGIFEIFAFLVLISVIVFWIRRNILKISRFWKNEMKGWPKLDADLILYFEVFLMSMFLLMNGADNIIQKNFPDNLNYVKAGFFPVSQYISLFLDGLSLEKLVFVERTAWWLHIIGIFIFLNYLYFSKHLHIILAFPNTFFSNLNTKGRFENLNSVTNEVKIFLDPNSSISNPVGNDAIPDKFGASDVLDLNWVQLMNAYSCTECGRCSSDCPANQTGKLLSPRKIMMDTRDRLNEVGNNISKNKGKFEDDGKQLLGDYIKPEELWACTSCNACVESCPIDIDPLSIIMSMRQFLVMEKSDAPSDINNMMNNIENNGAPWPFNQNDRAIWSHEI
ncbi:MAG: 4Fe-4S dicluster domain-containing protein [Flavobacteriaceae bacterium]